MQGGLTELTDARNQDVGEPARRVLLREDLKERKRRREKTDGRRQSPPDIRLLSHLWTTKLPPAGSRQLAEGVLPPPTRPAYSESRPGAEATARKVARPPHAYSLRSRRLGHM